MLIPVQAASCPASGGDDFVPALARGRELFDGAWRAAHGARPTLFDTPGPTSIGEAIDALAANAEGAHGDRRRAGSFYTAPDVTAYIVSRTVVAAVLDRLVAAGLVCVNVDAAITTNIDLETCALEQLAQLDGDGLAAARRSFTGLRVLDPTCGAGAFLLEAGRVLARLGAAIGAPPGAWLRSLHGVDLSPVAVEACRASLALLACELGGGPPAARTLRELERQVTCADALTGPTAGLLAPRGGGFDAVIGNPPYVRDSAARHPLAVQQLRSASCGNLFAWVTEHALAATRAGGRAGFIVPVSALCADAFEPYRELWRDACGPVWASSYDTIPSTLFTGTVQRLAIVLGRTAKHGVAPTSRWHVTRYHKWRAAQRRRLFASLRYVPMPPQAVRGSVAKVGTAIEAAMLERLFAHRPAGELLLARGRGDGDNRFWYKRRWSYFLLFVDFMPELYDADGMLREPSEFKPVNVAPSVDAKALLAAYNSTLFYWFFTVFSDNRNVNLRDLAAFPFNPPAPGCMRSLAALAGELMAELRASSELRECTYQSIGTIRNTYFRQGATKHVIDRIDGELAGHYGFDREQLEFITGFESDFRSATPRP